jgi:hypothetical protein
MALPEQIRRQTEAVQELYKQLNNADDNTGGKPTDGTVPPVGDDDAQDNQPADVNAAANNAAPSPANEHKSGGETVPEESVLQKYKTLQGMYNAEVPRLHQQNREMSQRVQQMEQLLASLSAQQSQTTTSQPQQAEKFVTEKDVEEYGESIDMMRKVSREELAAVAQRIAKIEQMLQQVQSNVVPQVQNLAHRQQMSAEQQFWADLASAVPNFREVNGNEAFQSWLLETDPLTGITRQTYLDDAQRSLDARRVANFFRTWLEITGQAAVAQSTGRASNPELEKQVAPGRSRGAGSANSTNKAKTYSPDDIRAFFDAVRSGKYKGREQERDRIERDIFAAQRENRIVTNA